MRMIPLLPALSAALLLTGTAAAQTAPATAAAPSTDAPAAKPKKEKKICRDSDASSYSRMPARVCKTQAEWNRNAGTPVADPGVRSSGTDNH